MLDISSSSKIKGVRSYVSDLNQLYHPTGEILQDSQSVVYSFGNLNTTKFVPILLKEWFFLVKKGGYLVVDYLPNDRCDFQKLEETMWWLWKGKYEIVYHGPIDQKELKGQTEKSLQEFIHSKEAYYKTNLNHETKLPTLLPTETIPAAENGYLRFVCKKTVSTVIPGDAITKWTFGIITNGKRKDWMEQIIQSIRAQKVPNYEIIICGTYYQPKDKDIKYLPFNQRDDKGWITRKKNLIVQHAKYENLCIIHDRIVFDKEWYKGMKRWGNCFEYATNCISYEGNRAGDWVAYEENSVLFNGKNLYFVSELDYKDWRKNGFIGGMFYIGKKYILQNAWNENLYWSESEDIDLSKRLLKKGILHRFILESKVNTLVWRFKTLSKLKFTSEFDSSFQYGAKSVIVGRKMILATQKLGLHKVLIPLGWKLFFEPGWFKNFPLKFNRKKDKILP